MVVVGKLKPRALGLHCQLVQVVGHLLEVVLGQRANQPNVVVHALDVRVRLDHYARNDILRPQRLRNREVILRRLPRARENMAARAPEACVVQRLAKLRGALAGHTGALHRPVANRRDLGQRSLQVGRQLLAHSVELNPRRLRQGCRVNLLWNCGQKRCGSSRGRPLLQKGSPGNSVHWKLQSRSRQFQGCGARDVIPIRHQ